MNVSDDIKEMIRNFQSARDMFTSHGDATALDIAGDIVTRLQFMLTRSEIKRIKPIDGGRIEIVPGEDESTLLSFNDGIYHHGVNLVLTPNELLALTMLLLERHNDIGINRVSKTEENNG